MQALIPQRKNRIQDENLSDENFPSPIFTTVLSGQEFLLVIDEQVVIKNKRLISKFENKCRYEAYWRVI